MKYEHLRDEIIIPSLKLLACAEPNIDSESAVNLLVGIVAHESRGGYYLRQVNGPALGIYQIEPGSLHDLLLNFLFDRHRLSARLTMPDRWRESMT